ncbi:MazG-like family protein [Actinocorallia sp. API 0066]|uniref:MazG-like family protein n=1 Tax=Actinocorallia sp. API 0066 TaxID=2896846 RepID=UPI001E4C897E|nr:MazG-like family protein [Actinocorallia sp. API 0066]MCD0450076.1 MazG-like family protein [Actinocorallia sp. API 0066]
MSVYDPWPSVRRFASHLDEVNGTGEAERALRVLKLTEEIGEVSQAYIGFVGQNPRKGVTHTRAEVAAELCDVVITAMVALCSFTDDPARALRDKIEKVDARYMEA